MQKLLLGGTGQVEKGKVSSCIGADSVLLEQEINYDGDKGGDERIGEMIATRKKGENWEKGIGVKTS